jgi:transcription antitermination protein NusB
MSQRHLSRSIVLQTLFEWDFEGLPESQIQTVFERNIREFAPGTHDRPFMDNLLRTVLNKRRDLDSLIEKAAPDWPTIRLLR